MKKFIIVCILLGFILSVIFIFLFYKPDVSSTNNLFEEMTFINESIPIQNKNLLCRMNIRNYLENLDLDLIECVSHINLNERVKHGFKKPTILFIIDHEFKSSDKSAKNYFNFLDNENLILCISEDWLDKAHPKLQLWPIGLESKMILKNYLVKILLEKMSTPIEGQGTMSNAHFKTYKHPASSYRDDRNDMVRALKNENIVDFWNQRQSQADTLQLTQNYAYKTKKNIQRLMSTYCVLYSYFETDKSMKNLNFFLQNGIVKNDYVFYVFIINNDNYQIRIPHQENIKVITRENIGHDFGSWKHGLESLKETFDYYVFMNDTVCGPFLPRYIPKTIPWYQMFCHLLSDVVKLSGLTINYFPWGRSGNNLEHVQSMMFCTDKIGLDILKKEIFHYSFKQYEDIYNTNRKNFIIQFEIGLSKCIIKNG